MNWIVGQVKWLMLVSGVVTCAMFYAAIAPQAALRAASGESLEGPLVEIVVRHWGALISLTGLMLIYGAYKPVSRRLILTVASLSKLIFIAMVVTYGRQYLGLPAGVAVVADLVMVVLFAAYLIGVCRGQSAGQPRLAEDAPKGGAG